MTIKDNLGENLGNIANWITFYQHERAQMYGILINLMIDLGVTEVEYDFNDIRYATDYLITMIPNKEKETITIKLTREEQ